MKRTLFTMIIVVLGTAFSAACSTSGATTVASGDNPTSTATELRTPPLDDALPGQLQLDDVSPGLKACAHQAGRRWNVEFLGPVRIGSDGLNFIDIREHLPTGVEEGPFLAAGYGLEQSTIGDIGSFARLSAGFCTSSNDLS